MFVIISRCRALLLFVQLEKALLWGDELGKDEHSQLQSLGEQLGAQSPDWISVLTGLQSQEPLQGAQPTQPEAAVPQARSPWVRADLEDWFSSFFLVFLGPRPWHMEVARLGVESELQLLAYVIATATPDLSHLCNPHHSSQQCQILNLLNRPGIESVSSWMLIRFISAKPRQELHIFKPLCFPF